MADRNDMGDTEETRLDLIWPPPETPGPADSGDVAESSRPWVGIHFECCAVYTRVYRSPEAREYVGHCPKCGLVVRVAVGPGGVATKLLRARVT